MSSLTRHAADGGGRKDDMIAENDSVVDTEPREPFVHVLARLGHAVERGEMPRWAAIVELAKHPLVGLHCEHDGWDIGDAYLRVADAIDTWADTLFEIMVLDPTDQDETTELRHVLDRWARGETDAPAPAGR